MNNVPADWGQYYRNCTRCGARYHASEGGCGACDEKTDEQLQDEQDRAEAELEAKAERDAEAKLERDWWPI